MLKKFFSRKCNYNSFWNHFIKPFLKSFFYDYVTLMKLEMLNTFQKVITLILSLFKFKKNAFRKVAYNRNVKVIILFMFCLRCKLWD